MKTQLYTDLSSEELVVLRQLPGYSYGNVPRYIGDIIRKHIDSPEVQLVLERRKVQRLEREVQNARGLANFFRKKAEQPTTRSAA